MQVYFWSYTQKIHIISNTYDSLLKNLSSTTKFVPTEIEESNNKMQKKGKKVQRQYPKKRRAKQFNNKLHQKKKIKII